MPALQDSRERHLSKANLPILTFGREVLKTLDAMPTVPGIVARRGSLYEQRLSDLLHEEKDSDRAERTGQSFAEIWQPGLVDMSGDYSLFYLLSTNVCILIN